MACVLVVDDSPTDTAAFKEMLTRHGHSVIFATDGNGAIAATKEQKPDIILMDVVMPSLNGYQATRRLSQDKDTAHIPVVMISSKTQESDRVWGLRQGAKAYICKPTSETELVGIIDSMAIRQ